EASSATCRTRQHSRASAAEGRPDRLYHLVRKVESQSSVQRFLGLQNVWVTLIANAWRRQVLLPTRAESLSELSLKFRELTRTDSLPDVPHGVKEERQIVMRQKNARQHLSRQIKMPNERP